MKIRDINCNLRDRMRGTNTNQEVVQHAKE
jgi:hypothetical protein